MMHDQKNIKLFLCAFAKLLRETISVAMSVCLSAWIKTSPPWRIFIKFGICGFFKPCRENSSFIKIRLICAASKRCSSL